MPSSLGKFIADNRVSRDGAELVADMWRYPWGDLVLLHEASFHYPKPDRKKRTETLLAGSILRPNKQKARDTKGRTTHESFPDLYMAFRGSGHAVSNYGAEGGIPDTEEAEVQTTIQALHEYVTLLFSLEPHFAHVLTDVKVGMGDLAKSYQYKINEQKKRAQAHMWRGIMDTDSLGRNNPGAQRYAMYGAGNELRKREDAIQWLSMHMDHKTARCLRLINEHVELYNRLWLEICTASATSQLSNWQAHGLKYAMIKDLYQRILAIRVRPFRRLAAQTERDLRELISAMEKQQPPEVIYSIVNRLREGTRWVFALDTLQMQIIFPLSGLVHRLERQEKNRRRRTKKKGPIRITFDMAPDEFGSLAKMIFTDPPFVTRGEDELDQSFETRLGRINDQDLRSPKKVSTLRWLEEVRYYADQDDWRGVKESLKEMASHI